MANKISGLDGTRATSIGVGTTSSRVAGSSKGDAAAAGTGAGDASDVQITGAASRLAAIEQSLLDSPAIDEKRVAEVRLAIEEGRYTVQPERVADGLLQMEGALAQVL